MGVEGESEMGLSHPSSCLNFPTYSPCPEAAPAWPGDFILGCSLTPFCKFRTLEHPRVALTVAENTAHASVESEVSHLSPSGTQSAAAGPGKLSPDPFWFADSLFTNSEIVGWGGGYLSYTHDDLGLEPQAL